MFQWLKKYRFKNVPMAENIPIIENVQIVENNLIENQKRCCKKEN
jgi:hypothetical protein